MKNYKLVLSVLAFALLLTLAGCNADKEKPKDKESPKVNSALQIKAPDNAHAIDNVHSVIIFKILHMNAGYVYGRFNDIGGYVALDDSDLSKSKILLKVDVNSIDTHNSKRDAHLKSPDFFDAKKFPIATYTSKKIDKLGKDKYRVNGEFELHGVKKDLSVEFTKIGQVEKDAFGFNRAGGEAIFTLKRSDYDIVGIDKKMPGLVGDDVELRVAIEGVHK